MDVRTGLQFGEIYIKWDKFVNISSMRQNEQKRKLILSPRYFPFGANLAQLKAKSDNFSIT